MTSHYQTNHSIYGCVGLLRTTLDQDKGSLVRKQGSALSQQRQWKRAKTGLNLAVPDRAVPSRKGALMSQNQNLNLNPVVNVRQDVKCEVPRCPPPSLTKPELLCFEKWVNIPDSRCTKTNNDYKTHCCNCGKWCFYTVLTRAVGCDRKCAHSCKIFFLNILKSLNISFIKKCSS